MLKKCIVFILLITIIAIAGCGGYYIYNKKFNNTTEVSVEPEKEKYWLLTMWGNDDARQMMSFTLEGSDGGLIIIDGGYAWSEIDTGNIEHIIEAHDNKVDAWIITHLDNDHVGTFTYMYDNHPEYNIGNIYCPDVFDLDLDYLKKDAPWETETWDLFTKIKSYELENLTKVHIGDTFESEDLLGLKMKVFSTYEPWMLKEGYTNIFNSGCMVFKLYGEKEDIMFTGDIAYDKNSEYLMNNYTQEELQSDQLQAPHHGNTTGINKELYDYINPTKMFFCAPKWLREDTKYDTHNLIDYCNENSIEIISYENVPYQMILR